jgi:hypothetical protein
MEDDPSDDTYSATDCMEPVLVRDVVTPETSKPSAEEETKKLQVQEVQKWITGTVQPTVFRYLKFDVLEMEVMNSIAARVDGWNWEIDTVDKCAVTNKNNEVMRDKTSVRGVERIATMKELVKNQIWAAIDFNELEATAMAATLQELMRKQILESIDFNELEATAIAAMMWKCQ